jgi:DNA helicase-2/ATP-dependent DNA helicase PcrA
LKADILALLRPDGSGLTVVGDPAQAIYAFRAATSANMAAFAQHFPGTTVVRLEENYRSIPPVLAVANAVMAAAPADSSPRQVLWSRRMGLVRPCLRRCEDEEAQADAVCDSVLAHRDDGVLLQHQAVLFRASHHADALELTLTRRNIPYVKYGGLRILEAAHVKDLLALLRVLDNPWHEIAWFRVLPLVDGIGQAIARRVMADLGLALALSPAGAAPASDVATPGDQWAAADPAISPLARLLAVPPRLPEAARGAIGELRAALAECTDGCLPGGATPAPAVQVERLSRWLQPAIERRYSSPAARMADLAQLAQVAARYPDRNRFITELTLDPPVATGDLAGPPLLDEDWLVLSTVHSAKGGEWDVVHIIHAADGMFPSDMACGDAASIEEERRLLYVAVTRARDVLEINVPLRYHMHRQPFRPSSDRHLYAQVSRFLTDDVQDLMVHEHVGTAGGPDGGALDGGASDGAATDGILVAGGMDAVDRFLSGLWA